MPRRSDARRVVLQMLYLIDQNPDADVRRVRESIEEELKRDDLVDFAWAVFLGVRDRREDLDQRIRKAAHNWRIERMAPTDRNIIRMGIYEIEFVQTPAPVVLNEMIELAREFGTENSPAFVNGILDRLNSDRGETNDSENS
ncbi:MAG: transcription antitermination factor NusB [Planctomycetaceae bacterium]|nr:transcription antitermination factor NusB [Planctomycetaceae bacterium]